MKRCLSFLLCLVLLFTAGACTAQSDPASTPDDRPLLDGATLVTFGASNTSLSKWPQAVAEALNMHLVNAGIGGNTTAHGLARFDRDVASADPDFVTICFGTNDFYRKNGEPQVSPEEYRANLQAMIEHTEALGAIPILITSPIITETASGGAMRYPEGSVNAALDIYVEIMREIAAAQNVHLIDIHALGDESYSAAEFLSADGVHLSATGDKAFSDAVIDYMKTHFRQDPDAPRVEQPTAPTVEKGPWTKSIVPASLEDWLIVYPDTVNASMNEDGVVSFANTTGEWPEVHYSPKLPDTVAAYVGKTQLNLDLELEAAAHILLFFNGCTPTVQSTNEYVSLTAAIQKQMPSLRVTGSDIQGGQHIKCSIPLLEVIPANCIRDDGSVLFSGVKVFVIGTAGMPVTIREMSITSQ